jgi:alcohol dehydrogenase class IV
MMSDNFNFRLQTNTFYGLGRSRKIGAFLKENTFNRVLIFVDEGCAGKSDYFSEIEDIIRKNVGIVHVELLRGSEEPDYDYLDSVASKARGLGEIDIVIGIGGGSCLDIAKAVAALMTNPGKAINYRGFDKLNVPGLPTIAVPTTAGTGSEVTINAVFTDKKEMKKLGINGRYMNATYSIMDALWTMSCPPSVALSSGMDALTHTLESFSCKQHNTLTRMYSKEAFRLLYENLPALIDDSGNLERRQLILLGSHLAGIALFNSGAGIAGAFSYPIGVHFKMPHGICGGIFLATVVEYNVSKGYTDYAELLDLVEYHPDYSLETKSRKSAQLIHELSLKLGVPAYLDEWGITRRNIGEVAELLLPLQAAFDQNPIMFSAEKDAPEMLRRHVRDE